MKNDTPVTGLTFILGGLFAIVALGAVGGLWLMLLAGIIGNLYDLPTPGYGTSIAIFMLYRAVSAKVSNKKDDKNEGPSSTGRVRTLPGSEMWN